MLSQAYASLHAEYVSLKTSQIHDQHSYHPQYDPAAYGAGPAAMALNPAVDGLEMDMFVYSDVNTGYAL